MEGSLVLTAAFVFVCFAGLRAGVVEASDVLADFLEETYFLQL